MAVRKTKFSFALIGETRNSKVILMYFSLYIKHLQLCKSPCPRKSQNGEFGGFLRISDLRNADFSNSPFCQNRDKSLQFNLKHRHKKKPFVVSKRHQSKKNGGKDQDRTGDTRIFSPLLYQLSYPATWDQYLIGYDSSNIHPFCDLSSRFLKKSRFFQAEENVFYGGLQLEMMFLQLSISIRNCKKTIKDCKELLKNIKSL